MPTTEKDEVKKLNDAELEHIVETQTPSSERRRFAKEELAARKKRKECLYRLFIGLPAWIALVLSILSLYLNYTK